VDDALSTAVRRLTSASRRAYGDATAAVDWPDSVDHESWCMSRELISLTGSATWYGLDEERRVRLSFWEAVNFFSVNVHGERALMAGLARRLYSPGLEPVADYLHHFLDEENRHSVWFATFCLRYGGKIYPDRTVAFGPDSDIDDLLFFARAALFEEIVDRFNVAMAGDERLVPVVRQINGLHHTDEARHLVFGRRLVADLFGARQWTDEALTEIRSQLGGFLDTTWRSLANPAVYRDAGLDDPVTCARQAWDDPACRARRVRMTAAAVRPFVDMGLLVGD
jgi:hypothetical protein